MISLDLSSLKQQLEELQQNNYIQLQKNDLNALTSTMLAHIGITDEYTREMLIYQCFRYFIEERVLVSDQLEDLLSACLEQNYLYLDISIPQTDAIFTRSSVLALITLIIKYDTAHSCLQSNQVIKTLEIVLQYFVLETDYRVYIPYKGYPQTLLKGTDTLYALIGNPNIPSSYYEEIIHCLINKVFNHHIVYYNEEDEYVITPLLAILYREFSQNQLMSIIEGKLQRLPQIKEKVTFNQYHILCTNIKCFLRTLFFRTRQDLILKTITNQTEKILIKFNTIYGFSTRLKKIENQ